MITNTDINRKAKMQTSIKDVLKKMYRGKLETPSTIKADKKHREELTETLLKGVNILRDGNDIDFALEFIKRHIK